MNIAQYGSRGAAVPVRVTSAARGGAPAPAADGVAARARSSGRKTGGLPLPARREEAVDAPKAASASTP
eukprot:CAMPEP_0176333148 /NCGR_PEP_ID=MMETSP0121_2-20121125/77436_1 /TAXON_ID=160619 /ORGANISM="Kryptoperidinium foliaceum, Strain CCMP 1326" /LENGTH=68 /DNA_ID=CAMNT_0017676055 /DNA_START=14 /DNA_END=222 /DNA_ORIENTATION=-